MKVIGITGGIASGKSTLTEQLQSLGVETHSADEIVHGLLGKKGKAVAKVAKLFPEALEDGAINRKTLGAIVFKSDAKLKKLEKLLHPLVQAEEQRLVKLAKAKKLPLIAFEIPLLFETGAEKWLDVVITTSVKKSLQKKRALKRKHMTHKKLKSILERQWTDKERAAKADYVVKTHRGKAVALRDLKSILSEL